MSEDTVVKLVQPGMFTDQLTEILRSGARALLTQAVEAEVAEFLAKHASLKTEMTGIGPVAVCHRASATVALPPPIPSGSASRPRSCRLTRAAPRAWRC